VAAAAAGGSGDTRLSSGKKAAARQLGWALGLCAEQSPSKFPPLLREFNLPVDQLVGLVICPPELTP
jgi:hypothetical protein